MTTSTEQTMADDLRRLIELADLALDALDPEVFSAPDADRAAVRRAAALVTFMAGLDDALDAGVTQPRPYEPAPEHAIRIGDSDGVLTPQDGTCYVRSLTTLTINRIVYTYSYHLVEREGGWHVLHASLYRADSHGGPTSAAHRTADALIAAAVTEWMADHDAERVCGQRAQRATVARQIETRIAERERELLALRDELRAVEHGIAALGHQR